MKRFTKVLIIFAVIFTMFCVPAFAETATEPAEPTETPTESETPNKDVIVPQTEETPTDEENKGWWDKYFNIDTWINLGGISLTGLLLWLVSNAGKKAIYDFMNGTKKYAEKLITKEQFKDTLSKIIDDYDKHRQQTDKALEEKINKLEKLTIKQASILSICFTYQKIPETAKEKIYHLLQSGEDFTGGLNEVFTESVKEIEEAEKTMPKEETPAIDEIISEEEKAEETTNNVMRLE